MAAVLILQLQPGLLNLTMMTAQNALTLSATNRFDSVLKFRLCTLVGVRTPHAMTLRVADCQAAYEALRSRGAAFLTPPHDRGTEIRCPSGSW